MSAGEAAQASRVLDDLFMRLFVGIPLATAVIEGLAKVSSRLRSGGDGLRWTARESWHITLQFLGNTGSEQYECVVARLRELHLRPVPIGLDGLGFFDRTGVFFAGVKVSPELESLQMRVTEATALCGFVSETRPYQPHITLARSKDRGRQHGVDELKARIRRPAKLSSFVAGEFLLYESFLGAGEPRYEILERFALDGN
ncbi:MAG: RNA 2',3'-cyclic phosphodiesterase [Terracidiphilus sp.]